MLNSQALRASFFTGLLILIAMFPNFSLAQDSTASTVTVPNLIRFTGTLLDSGGAPRSGTVGVTFAIYKDQTGGSPLWIETQNVTADNGGHYSALLGATKPEGILVDIFTTGEARWLSVKPEGEDELPRVLLVSVPYALKAADAETLGGLPASAFMRTSLAGSNPLTFSNMALVAPPQLNTLDTGSSSGTANYIAKWTNSTTLGNSLIFDDGTKVGINTSTPAATLDVNATNIIFRSPITNFSTALSYGPQFAFVNNASPIPASWRFGVPGAANSTSFFIYDYVNKYAPFTLEKGAGANALYFKAGGNVGIGTSTPGNKLSVTGTIESTSGGFKFPDATTQTSAAITLTSADKRYLQLTGGTLTGALTATSFTGNGANLTSLTPTNLNGIVPSNHLPGTIAYKNVTNGFGILQNFFGGASISVQGTGTSGTALNVFNSDDNPDNPTALIVNNGNGTILTLSGPNNGTTFYSNGYYDSMGWAPVLDYDSINAPVAAGQLVKLTMSGMAAPLSLNDSNPAIGVILQTGTNDNGKSKAQMAITGIANCTFDNTAAVGDYVTVSTTTAANCHDAGLNFPGVGQVIGRVVDVSNGNTVFLTASNDTRAAPIFVSKLRLTSQTAEVPTTALFTPTADGTYRVSIYMSSGNAAGGSIAATLSWTDDVGAQSTTTNTITAAQTFDSKTIVIRATSGNPINYATQFTGVSGTPSYNVYYSVELIDTD